MEVSEEVAAALEAGRPVVALESTIIAHGLPRPRNLDIARELETVVRDAGAVPATIAMLDGEVHVGLEDWGLRRIAGHHSQQIDAILGYEYGPVAVHRDDMIIR